ncbi:MaoC/PaaZ C-terminal domain-containing protein [Mesorhizobium muleiense]|uniref:MaoC/PaaZ C-terminal domain-containing protein n=1 Tax=Mesorhizobium muleiense TaxID=1004279 RepID=UPI001F350921|nr:MaoC/PaaZ C-terminal domain-containing protein [Mesorhizobium muleiense]MCF6110419.1 MaoC family dehydratase N-terminal domain-containing protein [Mesorhizobium muleiense]
MEITFDKIEVGVEYRSAGRTVCEADIVNFAGVTGDFNSLHMDSEWVRANTPYPTRIAHGLLVHAIGEGLRCKEVDSWKILAFLETHRRMLLPVLPGDRIQQNYRVASKKPTSKDTSKGVVEVEVTVTNQKDETVQSGYNRYLIGGAS